MWKYISLWLLDFDICHNLNFKIKMRLAIALLRKKMPNGHIYRGKYRIVPPTTGKHIAQKRIDYEIEEKNMLYLRHPFLTPVSIFCC